MLDSIDFGNGRGKIDLCIVSHSKLPKTWLSYMDQRIDKNNLKLKLEVVIEEWE